MAFKSKPSQVGTSFAAVTATVAAGTTATVIGFSLANTGSSNITVSAKMVKDNGDEGYLVKDATVLPGGALVIIGGDQKHVLEEGDSIQASASIASADAIVSYLV
mgnify:CR=1 FL=1